MRNITILFLTFFTTLAFSQNRGDQIFDESYVHDINITCDLSIIDMYNILFDEFFEEEKSYTLAQVTIDGVLMDSVGIRVKGGVSAFDSKKPMKLDFNEFVPGQRYDGLKKLNLHQGNQDPSFLRETMTYKLFRNAGVKTVRTSFANVYVNGSYEGVYTLVEQIDDNFIKNRFASNEGALYKTGATVDLDLKYEENNPLPYNDFVEAVNQIPTPDLHLELENYLDVESFLRFFATQIFVNGVDGPLTVDKNYYIYYEPKSALYVYIPWDYNLSLYGFINHTLFAESQNFLLNRALSNPTLRAKYLDTYCTLFAYNFVEETILEQIESYRLLLQDHVPNDPYLIVTGDWNQGIETLKNVITDRINDLSTELSQHITSCSDLVSPIDPKNLVINEIMASNNEESGIADPSGSNADWIELYNNTSININLSNFYLSNDRDVLKHWRFPEGTEILAEDYLIIWADRDVNEEGLHTGFKLNKTQGELVLSFEDGSIIDEMDFSNQETNIGFARVPNGIGEFIKQEATFGSQNELSTSTQDESFGNEWSTYPNLLRSGQDLIIHSSSNQNAEIQIMDMVGQIIWKREMILHVGENILPLSGVTFNAGLHIIHLNAKSSLAQQTQKIMIY